MKQVYKIGTKQYFTYSEPTIFKRNRKVENHWVVRNVQYVYAKDFDEAVNKYNYKSYSKITHGYDNWHSRDNGTSLWMQEKYITILHSEICEVKMNGSEKYDDYKNGRPQKILENGGLNS